MERPVGDLPIAMIVPLRDIAHEIVQFVQFGFADLGCGKSRRLPLEQQARLGQFESGHVECRA